MSSKGSGNAHGDAGGFEGFKPSESHQLSEKISNRLQDSLDNSSREQHVQHSKDESNPQKRMHKQTAGRKHLGECLIMDNSHDVTYKGQKHFDVSKAMGQASEKAYSRDSLNHAHDKSPSQQQILRLESSARPGQYTLGTVIDKQTAKDKAESETLNNFENTNCHAATMRKMGLDPIMGGSTQMNQMFMEMHGYKRVNINSNDQLRPGDVVATPYEFGPKNFHAKTTPDIAFGHTGVAERDAQTGQMTITEKIGPGKYPYLRQTPDDFAKQWTHEGGLANNNDIWVYRKVSEHSDSKSKSTDSANHARAEHSAKQLAPHVSEHSLHIPPYRNQDGDTQHGLAKRGALLNRLSDSHHEHKSSADQHKVTHGALLHRLLEKQQDSHSSRPDIHTNHHPSSALLQRLMQKQHEPSSPAETQIQQPIQTQQQEINTNSMLRPLVNAFNVSKHWESYASPRPQDNAVHTYNGQALMQSGFGSYIKQNVDRHVGTNQQARLTNFTSYASHVRHYEK